MDPEIYQAFRDKEDLLILFVFGEETLEWLARIRDPDVILI